MSDDDSPWMDDEPHGSLAAPSAPTGLISQQEWDKLSTRFSDVRVPPLQRPGLCRAKS